jgi:hypothetical protein
VPIATRATTSFASNLRRSYPLSCIDRLPIAFRNAVSDRRSYPPKTSLPTPPKVTREAQPLRRTLIVVQDETSTEGLDSNG